MTNSSSFEPVDLSDPAIEPLRLQELAQTHPHLWDEILQHPNVYPGLADWIRERQAAEAANQPSDEAEQRTTEQQPTTDLSDDEVQDDSESTEPQTSWFAGPEAHEPTAAQPQASHETEQTQHFGWAQPTAADPNQAGPQQPPHYGADQPPFGRPQSTGYAQPSGYPQPQPQQQPFQAQPGTQQNQYAAPQYQGQQPGQYMMPARKPSKIDFSTRRTWGLLITGAAAFLAIFGFFFAPSASPRVLGGLTHMSSGGWFLMLLLIATVALAALELFLENPWTRYFFIVLGIGASFAILGRYMVVGTFFSLSGAGFSMVWIIFMAIVVLAGTMVYLAPATTMARAGQPPRQPQPYQPAGGQPQNPTSQPWAQHNQPGAPQQFGGYQPPQHPGSPQ